MSYQVLARKYRSQTFQDLVGQSHITQTLINAMESNRFPHALLFCGTRGVGKTSSARILAKTLICPNQKDYKPCNECPACVDITAGSHMDVIEIDGASNNGVDAIRELRETVGYTPSNGKYKIYIIDEVHMLSTSAFNALLKTLEEPPAHAIFVLATTEVQKIPVTILSRCQRFDFRKISTKNIQQHLSALCKSESLEHDEDSLWLLARLGDGSMRDALSLLEQTINFTQGKLTAKNISDVLGLTDQTLILDTLKALISRDLTACVHAVEKIFEKGADPINFAQSLLDSVRDLLIIKVSKNTTQLIDISDSEISILTELSKDLTAEDIHMIFDMLLKGAQDLSRAQNSRIVLEMLLLRIAQSPRMENIESFINSNGTTTKPTAPQTNINLSKPHSTPVPAVQKVVTTAEPTNLVSKITPTLPQDWGSFVNLVKAQSPILGTQLEHAALAKEENNLMTLEVPETESFFYDQLRDTKQIEKLKAFLKSLWSKDTQVEIVLKKEALTPKVIQNKKDEEKAEKVQNQIENHPLVSKIKQSFSGKVTDIQELNI